MRNLRNLGIVMEMLLREMIIIIIIIPKVVMVEAITVMNQIMNKDYVNNTKIVVYICQIISLVIIICE